MVNLFTRELIENEKEYISVLRESEKSFYQDWSTLETWQLFFIKKLIESAEKIRLIEKNKLSEKLLSEAQIKIIKAIKRLGLSSRAEIEKESGININTIKYHLGPLVESGHIKRTGNAKNTKYSI